MPGSSRLNSNRDRLDRDQLRLIHRLGMELYSLMLVWRSMRALLTRSGRVRGRCRERTRIRRMLGMY